MVNKIKLAKERKTEEKKKEQKAKREAAKEAEPKQAEPQVWKVPTFWLQFFILRFRIIISNIANSETFIVRSKNKITCFDPQQIKFHQSLIFQAEKDEGATTKDEHDASEL